MKLIDTNALIVLILGLIDPKLVGKHKRASIYEISDFKKLVIIIENVEDLVILPNVWTEVDNLLHDKLAGDYKRKYLEVLNVLVNKSQEKYLETINVVPESYFSSLGVTDSLLLYLNNQISLLITGDSVLSDYANSNGIEVWDMVKERNIRL